MLVTFNGVRGSYPVPKRDMMKYGGQTASVMFTKEVDFKGNKKKIYLFIDAGIGIIDAGKKIVPTFFDGTGSKEFTMLFTHLHPDHTEGFTFFAPNFIPGTKIHLMGPSSLKKNVGIVLRDKMAPPTYPIEYKDLKSKRDHYVVEDGQCFYIDKNGAPVIVPIQTGTEKDYAFQIKVMQSFAPSHPQQGSLYYRITDTETGRSVACIWDIESRKGGDQRVIQFAKDADVMIHDTQYTEEEYDSPKMVVQGFGHSTYEMGIENARQANVGLFVPFHYNPAHTDQKLDDIYASLAPKIGKDMGYWFATEGKSIEILDKVECNK